MGATLRSYLSFCASPYDGNASDLERIINRPNRFVTNDAVGALAAQEHPWAYLNDLAYGTDAAPNRHQHLVQLIVSIRETHEATRNRDVSPVQLIDVICNRFAFIKKGAGKTGAEADDETDDVVLHVIRQDAADFSDLNSFLAHAERSAREENGEEINESAARIKPSEDDGNVVTLATIHGAKGREWPVVCLFDSSQPADHVSASPTEEEENRRVFYVGMTRAISSLQISFIENRPSPFIHEAVLPHINLREASAAERQRWSESNAIRVRELDSEINELNSKIAFLEDRLSEAIEGRPPRQLITKQESAQRKRTELSDHLIALSNERPSGILSRLFGSGRSGSDIATVIGATERLLETLDAEILSVEKELTSIRRNGPEYAAQIERELVSLRHARNLQVRKIESLKGDAEDLARCKAIPSLGTT